MSDGAKALADANECRRIRPDWPKACYRQGTALMLLKVTCWQMLTKCRWRYSWLLSSLSCNMLWMIHLIFASPAGLQRGFPTILWWAQAGPGERWDRRCTTVSIPSATLLVKLFPDSKSLNDLLGICRKALESLRKSRGSKAKWLSGGCK
jgi:hypothetical protein